MSRISPRSGLDAIALRSGLRTWTRPPLAKGEGGTGSREGVEGWGEKEKKKNTRDSWRRSPCWRCGLFRPGHGERRGARALVAGSHSPLVCRRRPRGTLFAQSLPLGDARSRPEPLREGRSGRGRSSSCRTIWLSLRRKSGLTWRLPGHVTAAATASRRAGEVERWGPRGRERRGGRGGFRPGSEVGPAIGPGRGENEGKGLGSRLGRREEEEENTPAFLLR